jgi:hypothetical protein
MTSLPARPQMTSRRFVPRSTSRLDVPMIVQPALATPGGSCSAR